MLRVIKFSASWCHPCKTYEPIFDKVQDKMKNENLEFIKCDVDQEDTMVEKYGIRNVPTTVIESDGKVVKRVSGIIKEEELESLIKQYI